VIGFDDKYANHDRCYRKNGSEISGAMVLGSQAVEKVLSTSLPGRYEQATASPEQKKTKGSVWKDLKNMF